MPSRATLFGTSLFQRLGGAAVLAMVLWLVVFWALS
jgi:hypothetical protein